MNTILLQILVSIHVILILCWGRIHEIIHHIGNHYCSQNSEVQMWGDGTASGEVEPWQALFASSMKWKKQELSTCKSYDGRHVPRYLASLSSVLLISSTPKISLKWIHLPLSVVASDAHPRFPSLKYLYLRRSFRSTELSVLLHSYQILRFPQERGPHMWLGVRSLVSHSFKKLRPTANFLTNCFHITSVI